MQKMAMLEAMIKRCQSFEVNELVLSSRLKRDRKQIWIGLMNKRK
jgi:hypothetical protein